MFRLLRESCSGRRGRSAPAPAAARFRPRVEALEDRSLLSSTTLTASVNPARVGQVIIFKAHVTFNPGEVIFGDVDFLDGNKVLATFPIDQNTQDAYFTTSTLSAGEHAIIAHYLGIPGISYTSYSPPVLEVVNGSSTPASPLGLELSTTVLRKHRKFLLQVTDATGAVRLSRTFPVRVQVLRQDVSGDGVLDVVVQWRRHRKLHRLAFSGRDLAPLPTGPA